MNKDPIQDLLRALADADAGAEASPEIESRLRQQFRSRKRTRRVGRLAWCASAAAGVVLVFVATVHYRQRPAPLPGPQAAVEEVVTEFYPLMDPAPPFERGRLLRVELPASAMRMVGLPVHAEHLSDPVQADVLVGEEGLPRAIRFVKFETK
jgi:hypothetical protein